MYFEYLKEYVCIIWITFPRKQTSKEILLYGGHKMLKYKINQCDSDSDVTLNAKINTKIWSPAVFISFMKRLQMVKNVIKICCPVPSLSSWIKGLFLLLLVSPLPLYFLRKSYSYESNIPGHVLVVNGGGGGELCVFLLGEHSGAQFLITAIHRLEYRNGHMCCASRSLFWVFYPPLSLAISLPTYYYTSTSLVVPWTPWWSPWHRSGGRSGCPTNDFVFLFVLLFL